MKNKLTVLLALCLLAAAPFATAEEKMKLDADGDGKVSYEEYKALKRKSAMNANLKRWIAMAMAILMPPKSKRKKTKCVPCAKSVNKKRNKLFRL